MFDNVENIKLLQIAIIRFAFSHEQSKKELRVFGQEWNAGNVTNDSVNYTLKARGISLQNRRNFLRILGEQKRKRGEGEMRVTREGRSAKKLFFSRSSPRARPAFASDRVKYAKKSPKIRKTLRLYCMHRLVEQQGMLIGNLKRAPKRYQDTVFGRGVKFCSPLGGANSKTKH